MTRKSVAVIAGAFRSQAPWIKQKKFQAHNQSEQSGHSSQSNTMDNTGFGSKWVVGVKRASVSNHMVSSIVVVSRGSSSESEHVALNADGGFPEVQVARLEKCVVGLTIIEPMGCHMPTEVQASKMLPLKSQSPTCDSSNRAMPFAKIARGWKRLASEKGSSTREYNMGS